MLCPKWDSDKITIGQCPWDSLGSTAEKFFIVRTRCFPQWRNCRTVFPFSWASLPVKITSEHRWLLYRKVASLTRLIPLVMPKAQKQAIEIGLDSPLSNPQLPGNLGVVASFQ